MGRWHYPKPKPPRMEFNGMNNVVIAGNLGQDPQTKTFDSGTTLAEFSIATQDTRKNGDSWEKVTDWHSVKVFGKQAENAAKYLHKGSKACIQGKLKTDTWEKDGEKKYKTYILATQVEFLDSKKDSQPSYSGTEGASIPDLEDVPF